MRRKGRAGILTGLLAVLLAATLTGLLVVWLAPTLFEDDALPARSCPVRTVPESVDVPELVGAESLVPAGSVGAERRPVVDGFEALGEPIGALESGRFYKAADQVPRLLPLGDRLGLVHPDRLRVVDLPDGDVAWSRTIDAPAARGGLVGDRLALLVGGASPGLLWFDAATGALDSCVAVPLSAGASGQTVDTLLTDQAGSDAVVVAGRPAAPVRLSRLRVGEAGEQAVVWSRELSGLGEAGAVTVASDTVVVSRVGSDPVRLAEMAIAGGIAAPMVTAYDAETGEPTWSYPDDPDLAATVIGDDADTGLLLVLEVSAGNATRDTKTRAALVALDPAGEEVWRRPLGRGLVSGSLWGDRVVVQGADPRGGALLRAFDLDGRAVWRLRSGDLPQRGTRQNFGSATAVRGRYLVPAPNGLLDVDPADGSVRRLDTDQRIDDLAVLGDHLVVRSGDAVLVLALTAP